MVGPRVFDSWLSISPSLPASSLPRRRRWLRADWTGCRRCRAPGSPHREAAVRRAWEPRVRCHRSTAGMRPRRERRTGASRESLAARRRSAAVETAVASAREQVATACGSARGGGVAAGVVCSCAPSPPCGGGDVSPGSALSREERRRWLRWLGGFATHDVGDECVAHEEVEVRRVRGGWGRVP